MPHLGCGTKLRICKILSIISNKETSLLLKQLNKVIPRVAKLNFQNRKIKINAEKREKVARKEGRSIVHNGNLRNQEKKREEMAQNK